MNSMAWCEKCGEYDFVKFHVCKPVWDAIRPDVQDEACPEDWYKTYGYFPDIAVENLCVRHFSDWDYPENIIIWIKKPEETTWRKYEVEVHPVPEFTATEQS